MTDLLYSLTGFGIGLLVGMTGLGGGSLLTPLLILLFGIHPATAVGTDLLYSAATKTAGSVVHGLARNIEWQVVRRLAAGSIPSAMVTLAILSLVILWTAPTLRHRCAKGWLRQSATTMRGAVHGRG